MEPVSAGVVSPAVVSSPEGSVEGEGLVVDPFSFF
jgi:hypothetical protein